MTVEQFRSLPETRGDFYYELHHGELVKMTRPKPKHWLIQTRLVRLLEAASHPSGLVGMEFSFCPRPEHQLWCADVAYLSPKQVATWDIENDFQGSPEIVIEVLSPSNSASEIDEKESMCLDNGCVEFWVVDPKRRTVKITKRDLVIAKYGDGDDIPLPLLGGAIISVAKIFQSLK